MGRGEESAPVLMCVQNVCEQESEEMASIILYHSDIVCEIYVVQLLYVVLLLIHKYSHTVVRNCDCIIWNFDIAA